MNLLKKIWFHLRRRRWMTWDEAYEMYFGYLDDECETLLDLKRKLAFIFTADRDDVIENLE